MLRFYISRAVLLVAAAIGIIPLVVAWAIIVVVAHTVVIVVVMVAWGVIAVVAPTLVGICVVCEGLPGLAGHAGDFNRITQLASHWEPCGPRCPQHQGPVIGVLAGPRNAGNDLGQLHLRDVEQQHDHIFAEHLVGLAFEVPGGGLEVAPVVEAQQSPAMRKRAC